MRTVVIGGGIAGLAVARALAERERDVTLLEAEPMLGTHSSARNAQIWLPVDDDWATGPLARRSAELLTGLLGDEPEWLVRSGAMVLVPGDDAVASLARGAERGGVEAREVEPDEARRRSPVLGPPGSIAPSDRAVLVPGAGVLDPHAMLTALRRACRDLGVQIRVGASAREIALGSRDVVLRGGERVPFDEVVIAAGAWARQLGRTAGVDVPMVPLRRHLALLEAPAQEAGMIVWRFAEPEVYWRPDSGGVLVSPCDEDVFDPCLPATGEALAERLVAALERIAPRWIDAPVRTAWACLRTYAHDRELVLGPDPRVDGLAWLAGLGGRGMTVGVAAGELCARVMDGEDASLAGPMNPARAQSSSLLDP